MFKATNYKPYELPKYLLVDTQIVPLNNEIIMDFFRRFFFWDQYWVTYVKSTIVKVIEAFFYVIYLSCIIN